MVHCWDAAACNSTLTSCFTLPHAGLFADHHGGWPHRKRTLLLELWRHSHALVSHPQHRSYLVLYVKPCKGDSQRGVIATNGNRSPAPACRLARPGSTDAA
jgi:hypothetical protein